MHIFSIKDLKTEGYMRPFFSATRMTAVREIAVGLVQDNTMSQFAGDFTLYDIGVFDADTGEITPNPPHHVAEISDIARNES